MDDLSNLIEVELEFDNTFLSQVVIGLGFDNSTISSNSTRVSEIDQEDSSRWHKSSQFVREIVLDAACKCSPEPQS